MALNRNLRVLNVFSNRLFAVRNSSSSTEKLINTEVNDKTGVVTLTLNRPPVNSLNLPLLKEFASTLNDLKQNKCRGMILTSSSNSVFSAGLDITEMYKPQGDRLREFWTTLQDAWISLYGSPYPTVAVINGHSPAGGCLLAMSCEYRIMAQNFTIGLNETQLGIIAPTWFIDTMQHTIGSRQTELALTLGRLFKTDEAHAIGLVDKVVGGKAEGLQAANEFLQQFSRIPPMARTLTKHAMRKGALDRLIANRENDIKIFVDYINQEKVQMGIHMYLESLKKKK